MTRSQWWSVGLGGILMIAGAVDGCSGGDHGHGHDHHGGCLFFREVEPNTTALTAQFLGDLFVDDGVHTIFVLMSCTT